MFDIGFLELVIVSVVGLLVLGPEKLPGAIRTASLWLGKLKRSFNNIRTEVERELRADEIRQDLHNQSIMQQLKNTEKELREGLGFDSPSAEQYDIPPGPDTGTDGPARASPPQDLPQTPPETGASATADNPDITADPPLPDATGENQTGQPSTGDSASPGSKPVDASDSRQP